ncbi:hypothetical protein AeNC1_001788 [Aphanomyces euteiches]|nr:hypothetical protein AeNC1_001788 [Aphanomyces euteiches]
MNDVSGGSGRLPTIQWSPSKISQVKPSSTLEDFNSLLAEIQDIDRRRTLLLNKAQRRCASTSSLSPKKRQPRSPLSLVDHRLEQHRLSTPHWDKAFPEDLTMCAQCGKDVQARSLKLHRETECPHRLVECLACGLTYSANAKMDHLSLHCVVHRRRAQWLQQHEHDLRDVCCLACRAIFPARSLTVHLHSECPKRRVACPHADLGCPKTDIVFDQLEIHESHECVVVKRRTALIEASKVTNQYVPCDWCNQPVIKRHLLDHKEDECLMRERQCPNAHLGCREWVPVGDFDKHVKSECVVTLERHALADQAKEKDTVEACRDCGTLVKRRLVPQHRSVQCVARFVPCANAIHGCTAMLKFRDRHIHEHVDPSPESRSFLSFHGLGGFVRIDGGQDLKPPWCAEFWVWLYAVDDDVRFLMREALTWQDRIAATTVKLNKWQRQLQELKAKLKASQKAGSIEKGLEAEALEIEDGMAGCKSILNEARARVKSLVSDAATLLKTITDTSARDQLEDELARQVTELRPSWSDQDIAVCGNVGKWLEAMEQAKGEEDVNHAKMLAKRMKLLKVIQAKKDIQDSRETARLVKQAKKELAKLDDKLAKCVDVPLALAQPTIGFHTLASSSTAGIHLMMASTGMPGLHSFEKKAKFGVSIPRGEWVHVAFHAAEENVTLFLNGAKASVAKGAFVLPMRTIGAEEKSFRGFMQEVRYWAGTRTPDELQQRMRDVAPVTEALRGYWTLEEGLGDFVDDVTGRMPRSAAVNVDWAHYTYDMTQLLGDPPTASFRQRNQCKIVTKRNFLASKHHNRRRHTTAPCSLGCGVEGTSSLSSSFGFIHSVEVRHMERHHKVDCPNRIVVCREPFCGHQIRARDTTSHDATCEVRLLRNKLAAEYYRKLQLVECPFGCSLAVARKAMPQHRKSACENRLVPCERCGESA